MIFGDRKGRGLDLLEGLDDLDPIDKNCTLARDKAASGEAPIGTLRPGWWRDAAIGPRAWTRGVRNWSGSGGSR